MKKNKPRNMAASVHDRLLALAKEQNEEFQALLTQYCYERLLYRLSQSPHHNVFILKGALLFFLWRNRPHRPTKDLDLLGRGDSSLERVEQLFRDICNQPVEADGLIFRSETIRTERIKKEEEYKGVRIRCEARLANARIVVQTDIGFGDAVTPAPTTVKFPTLLTFPAPQVLAYNRETVIAEKFQAMVMLGMANSRMKDFYDLWVLAQLFDFEGLTLCEALRATFQRRQTALPVDLPLALSAMFTNDKHKLQQWQGFLNKGRFDAGGADLNGIAIVLGEFLMPPARATANGEPFDMIWPPVSIRTSSAGWLSRATNR